ncbi:Soluble pyridine nucleotide transhydrogenase [Planctomycetes bacterium Poly30]|uniref:Soluble pyridine nucleotide transhydrogenase n=1 Tax=Saltatorellus ferox TaxID=2528018 RepID=A0A518EY24_9BACT|nr:Soluble pyridine nucleotide transhydrogenase [Planctomycetes bacterium Poly30]
MQHHDWIVIGGGPAGQKAALQGAREGRRVLLVDQGRAPGGECVNRGTIPSKTLRETARHFAEVRRRSADTLAVEVTPDVQLAGLMTRLDVVREAHAHTLSAQMEREGVTFRQARARFTGAKTLLLQPPSGASEDVSADAVFIATGSRPRKPADVPIDHENVLDSDSILSLVYLPRSLVVMGAGVIAIEFASIFISLGVEVTVIDRNTLPVGFMDEDLSRGFVRAFEARGGRFLGGRQYTDVAADGLGSVHVTLEDGEVVKGEKVLCALGRLPNLDRLDVEKAGLTRTERGYLVADAHGHTSVPGIYAAGDVIGPPALASTSMEQGRRAARHALGQPVPDEDFGMVPSGVYTIPEMGSVGLTEAQARETHGEVLVGRASFVELARGMIQGAEEGFLKIIADPTGTKILGCHALGEGSAELVHLGEMAMLGGLKPEVFVDRTFNFPTMAEAYRVAVQDLLAKARTARGSVPRVAA